MKQDTPEKGDTYDFQTLANYAHSIAEHAKTLQSILYDAQTLLVSNASHSDLPNLPPKEQSPSCGLVPDILNNLRETSSVLCLAVVFTLNLLPTPRERYISPTQPELTPTKLST